MYDEIEAKYLNKRMQRLCKSHTASRAVCFSEVAFNKRKEIKMTRRLLLSVMVFVFLTLGVDLAGAVQHKTNEVVATHKIVKEKPASKKKLIKKESTKRVVKKTKSTKRVVAYSGSKKNALSTARDNAKHGSVVQIGTTTAADLDKHFAKYNGKLVGKGKVFIEMEKKYGVSAKFMAAIATQESGAGKSARARRNNDCFGMTGYGKGKKWASIDANIENAFSLIHRLYVKQGRTTVASVGKKYCASSGWASKVQHIMNGI